MQTRTCVFLLILGIFSEQLYYFAEQLQTTASNCVELSRKGDFIESVHRGVFRTLSIIYNEELCENNLRLLTVNVTIFFGKQRFSSTQSQNLIKTETLALLLIC